MKKKCEREYQCIYLNNNTNWRFTHDELGELKASANVGHTYKAIGAYQVFQ